MSCIPVQHGVSLILPQETSPSCASKNCLHLSCVPVQFSFNITLRLYCQFGLRQIANASIYSPCTKFQFLFSSCSISRSAILPVFGRSIVRVALSYGYPCFMVFYVQKVETFCTRAPHLLLQMSTGHLKVRLFRFTDIIGYHTEFIAVWYGGIVIFVH